MDYKGYKDTDLVPDLIDAKEFHGDDFSVKDWRHHAMRPDYFISYSTLFYPNFEEYRDGVFFEGIENIKKRIDADSSLDKQGFIQLQKLSNQRHILDFFAQSNWHDSVSSEQAEFIAKTLGEIWTLKLKNDFPHLNTHVEVNRYVLGEVQITFWAESKSTS